MCVRNLIPLLSIVVVMFFYASCQKEYSIENGIIGNATGTLYDDAGDCMADTVHGHFYNAIAPGRDTAYVAVKVNVSTPGTYTIVSNTQNGVYFSDSGFFSTAGINTVKLRPVGTPIAIGTNSYTISFDSSVCYFTLTTNDSTGTGLGTTIVPQSGNVGQWQFSAKAGDTTRGINATGTLITTSGLNNISISGTNPKGDTALTINLVLPSATVPSSGQYTAAGGTATLQVSASSAIVYSGIKISGVTLTVNITSYSIYSKELKGTFSGIVKTTGGQNATLSSGSFDVILK